MGPNLPVAFTQSPGELKAQIEAERVGIPFLRFRDGADRQRIFTLGEADQVTVGRASASDLSLAWDTEVSSLHAELERVGEHWTISDDGLSRNGTYLNGVRVAGRRRLRNRDAVRFGRTVAIFHQTLVDEIPETGVAADAVDRASLSPAQRRVLVELCRPFKEATGYATPATNQQIADQLYLSVDAVKSHLRALFAKFGVEHLPQNQKRLRLVELALKSGVVTPRDI
jgi:pSer/pThr/pTyr-binding forkhead associated (FHA) protein